MKDTSEADCVFAALMFCFVRWGCRALVWRLAGAASDGGGSGIGGNDRGGRKKSGHVHAFVPVTPSMVRGRPLSLKHCYRSCS